jgi:hypothetical protein
MSSVNLVGGSKSIHSAAAVGDATATASAAQADAAALPPPLTALCTDDLETTLAVSMMKLQHDERTASDKQAAAAEKSQEEAQNRKIAEMHELAEDTFKTGLWDGITSGVTAAASGVGAVASFTSSLPGASGDTRLGKTLDAIGKSSEASGHLSGAFFKRDQELDREAMAVADADVDRAKSASESASSASKRAQDDMRDTIAAIRSYAASKSQLMQANVVRA